MDTQAAVERRASGSRFEGWSRAPAIAVLALLGLLILLGVVLGDVTRPDAGKVPESRTDLALYQAIVTRVQHGENYYTAAAVEQRERGFPLRPAMTMREPTLAYTAAAVGGVKHLRFVLIALGAVAGLAMLVKLEGMSSGRTMWWTSAGLTAMFSVAIFAPKYVVLHEVWASLLMLMSMLVRRPGRSAWPSVILGFLAVLVREIALPFMAVMALCAWRERKIKEARQWVIATAVFLAGYAIHYELVLSHTTAGDPQSQGWMRFGGWPFALSTVRESSLLTVLPFWVTAVAVPLVLLGWASRKGEFAIRVLALIAAFLAVFVVVGRPENFYWGILYAPLIGAGLAFAPSAVWTLFKRSRQPAPA